MGARSRSGARFERGRASAWCREARWAAAGALLWSWALAACALDFGVAGRDFECPAEVTACLACNPDGTCREPALIPPPPSKPPAGPAPSAPDAGGVAEDAGVPPATHPDASVPSEPPEPEPPDEVEPPVLAECAQFASRVSDELCLDGDARCFSLGSVLSPSLTAWLDPTTLPGEGSRYWCDRSGKGHHAILEPEDKSARVESDGRATGTTLSRSLTLDGAWLSLDEGGEPVLRPGNFAVLIAAATPLEASDSAALGLFESGGDSKLSLTIAEGEARGSISSTETSLVPDPVVTESGVYDGNFHL